jgi:uncharacterized protein
LSTPPNPISEPVVPPIPEDHAEGLLALGPVVVSPVEDPPWSGWDVLALAALTLVTIIVSVLVVAYVAHSHFLPDLSWIKAASRPEVIVGGQLLAYLFIFLLMYMMVHSRSGGHVLQALRWNWPENWTTYLLAGIGLELCLLPFAFLLPMPKHLPLDEFFKTARDAYILSAFGILFAPLFEELLFRGFLYPVLARRVGMYAAVLLTALGFAGIHASQLRYNWAPVLVIFLVGLALTTVRALKKSVACTVLMHMAYNGTIFTVAFIATDGFRHMEKFNQ